MLSPKVTEGLFVLCPQLGQDLLVAGLAAGDPAKVAAGRFADRHASAAKVPRMLRRLLLCCEVAAYFSEVSFSICRVLFHLFTVGISVRIKRFNFTR